MSAALLATRHALGYFTVGMTAILGVETVPERRLRLAMAELEAAEQVIQAAREAMDAAPALMSDSPFAHRLNDLAAALAVFDAAHKEET